MKQPLRSKAPRAQLETKVSCESNLKWGPSGHGLLGRSKGMFLEELQACKQAPVNLRSQGSLLPPPSDLPCSASCLSFLPAKFSHNGSSLMAPPLLVGLWFLVQILQHLRSEHSSPSDVTWLRDCLTSSPRFMGNPERATFQSHPRLAIPKCLDLEWPVFGSGTESYP